MLALLIACTVDGNGSAYPAADLVFFDLDSREPGIYDPRDGEVVVEGTTVEGHDWALVATDGALFVGVPELGEVRRYAMDGGDSAGGELEAGGMAIEAYGEALAVREGDLVVGVPDARDDTTRAGAVEVRGSETLRLTGDVSEGRLGTVVAACGDLDGDGEADLAASAPWEADLEGVVQVWSRVSGKKGSRLAGSHAGERFGGALACADVLGNDREGLLVGAPFAKGATETLGEGAVTVWDLSGPESTAPHATIFAPQEGDSAVLGSFGSAVVACRFSDSRPADIVVGAPTANGGSGAVYVYSGGEGLNAAARPEVSVVGDDAGGRLGSTLACGDVDGDGLDELFVGAPGVNGEDGVVEAGAVFAFTGVDSFTGTLRVEDAPWTFAAERSFLRTGAAFAVGDIDGDTRAELVLLVRQPVR